MNGIYKTLVIGLVAAAAGSASQIQIGQTTDGGLINLGLTCDWITSSTSCASTTLSGGAVEQNYATTLFNSVNTTLNPSNLPPDGNNGQTATSLLAGQAPGVDPTPQFALINEGSAGTGDLNAWLLGAGDSMTIPVGVFDVDAVYTMINDISATPTATSPTPFVITYNMSGPLGTDQVTYNFSPNTFDGFPNDHAWDNPTSSGACSNTSTTQCLYDQGLANLIGNSFRNLEAAALGVGSISAAQEGQQTLVSITIQNTSTSDTLAISAVTVDTLATPEPGTVLLLMSGLSVLGLAGLRRRRA